MKHRKERLAQFLQLVDLGSSVAEQDTLLETARVETSAFSDLYLDKVDLVPGTKGSGKSALYRIFVDFLADSLLQHKRVVVAHGVQAHGDSVFHAFKDHFEKLDEEDFVSFWCIYLVSLAHEHFVRGPRFAPYLEECSREIESFRLACQRARIPEVEARKSLKDILSWALDVLKHWKPTIKYVPPGDVGEIQMSLFGEAADGDSRTQEASAVFAGPKYISDVRDRLEEILVRCELSLWLMIDRLDEIFPRRSDVERRALRGLLRTIRLFDSSRIRVKVFLRDDILDQIVTSGQGFTALTHITARRADTLRWSEDQILTMIVKRLFAHESLRQYLGIDGERLAASRDYQQEAFYQVFPRTVFPGPNQSRTLRWIYNHTADGREVVTPRDVIDLLTRAKQRQQDDFSSDPSGEADYIIGSAAICYGLSELSKRKRSTFLEAEFPHLWRHISKFIRGKTEYSESAMKKLLGKQWSSIVDDLVGIGLLSESSRNGGKTFKFPFVYREGLELTQGRAE